MNSAKDPYESQLYSFHIARVQKWIHIIANRLDLYYKITTDEEEPEQFEQLHDWGYDLPFDIPGFETGKFDFYQNVIKDKPRLRKPKEHKQPGKHSLQKIQRKPLNIQGQILHNQVGLLLHCQVYILVNLNQKTWLKGGLHILGIFPNAQVLQERWELPI